MREAVPLAGRSAAFERALSMFQSLALDGDKCNGEK